tara:strand:+ start:1274 stop:1447 length:174 start_codon:yes stop_codon:yes gene_type:complete
VNPQRIFDNGSIHFLGLCLIDREKEAKNGHDLNDLQTKYGVLFTPTPVVQPKRLLRV